MEIRTLNGYQVVCNHIYKQEEIEVGQKWIPADGSKRLIEIRYNIDDWVGYGDYGSNTTCEKDWFSFQCRYVKILEEEKND